MTRISWLWSFAVLAVIPLCGCEKFSTAATMRVEVEVYKGPLSKDPETQMGELVGLMNEAADALRTLQDAIATFRDGAAPEDNQVARFHWRNIEDDLVDLIDGTRNLRIATNAWLRRHYPSYRSKGNPLGPPTARDGARAVEGTRCPQCPLPPANPREKETRSVDSLETVCESNINSRNPAAYYRCRREVFDLRYNVSVDDDVLRDYGACQPESPKHARSREIQTSIDKTRAIVWAFREAQRIERANALVRNREYEIERAKSWRKFECYFGECAKAKREEAERAAAMARIAVNGHDWAAGRLEKLEEELQCSEMSPPPTVFNEATLREIRTSLRAVLMHTSQLAERYRAKALLWAEAHVGVPPSVERARWAPATFSALTAQYADKLTSKADSLLKQVKGDDRRELPLSIALRESSPPDYLKLYVWNYAAASLEAESLDWTRGLQDRQDHVRDRVKVIERLFTDGSWTKVNTVYAGGQGTVRMALIKDDVGNWNLKSFDNDPTKLLEAYKNVGYAALSAATKAVAAASSGGASEAVSAALQLANKVSLGSGAGAGGGSPASANTVTELRADLVSQLRTLDQGAKTRTEALNKSVDETESAIAKDEPKVRALDEEVSRLQAQRNTAEDLQRKADAAIAAATAIATVAGSAPAGTIDGLRAQEQQKLEEARQHKAQANDARLASTNLEAKAEERRQARAALDALRAKFDALKVERANIAKVTLDKARQMLEQHRATLDTLEAALVARVENKALDKLKDVLPKSIDPQTLRSYVAQ